MDIMTKEQFIAGNFLMPMATKYSTKDVMDYEYFCIIPYEQFSTKTKGVEKYQKDNNFSVYEIRMTTMYLSVLIATQTEEEMNNVLSNREIIKSRK